jgi:hypothetical protein
VETNGSSQLITATKATGYNKAFGQVANTVVQGDDNRFGGGYLSVTGTVAFDETLAANVKSVLINLSGAVNDSYIRVPNPDTANGGMRIVFDLDSVILAAYQTLSIETASGTVIKQWVEATGSPLTFENALLIIYSDGYEGDWHIEYELYEGTTSQKGLQETATDAEAQTLTSDLVVLTPGNLNAVIAGLRRKIVNIGDWDMDSDAGLNISHGLTYDNIRGVSVLIRDDADSVRILLNSEDNSVAAVASTQIQMLRNGGGLFDNVSYDATSYNRGWIIIDYVN